MADTTILSINLISTNPTVRGGRPCIVGTGLRVTDLMFAHLFHQITADELASDYNLPISHVYAAFAYYYEHKAELDADMREQTRIGLEAREQHLGSKRAPLFPSNG